MEVWARYKKSKKCHSRKKDYLEMGLKCHLKNKFLSRLNTWYQLGDSFVKRKKRQYQRAKTQDFNNFLPFELTYGGVKPHSNMLALIAPEVSFPGEPKHWEVLPSSDFRFGGSYVKDKLTQSHGRGPKRNLLSGRDFLGKIPAVGESFTPLGPTQYLVSSLHFCLFSFPSMIDSSSVSPSKTSVFGSNPECLLKNNLLLNSKICTPDYKSSYCCISFLFFLAPSKKQFNSHRSPKLLHDSKAIHHGLSLLQRLLIHFIYQSEGMSDSHCASLLFLEISSFFYLQYSWSMQFILFWALMHQNANGLEEQKLECGLIWNCHQPHIE
ncbi:hypothetical protein VP01_3162g2 [Puccinia sorghi]|uniref:Uncharacterized protein n=1 Tax=Puccinia sorghi TaxID=27349 RepID=A0A0L6UZL7_9BASI|nr:hypothetical protein VP01_3162g2 [Puccinia sorghi]